MHPLKAYYLNTAGCGLTHSRGIVPEYSAPLYPQRVHGIGNFFGSFFRWVPSLIWRGAKAVGLETLRTRGIILTDIVENKSPDVSNKNILSKHVTESVQNLIGNLRSRGCKRVKRRSNSQGVINSVAEIASIDSDFAIIAPKPIHTSVL